MLEFIGKKIIHCFVAASIIFGCSVQATTPSFKEDLDDFEEMHSTVVGMQGASSYEAPVILWQNEDLSQSVVSAHGAFDDFEKCILPINQLTLVHFLRYEQNSAFIAHRVHHHLAFHQARAPPISI